MNWLDFLVKWFSVIFYSIVFICIFAFICALPFMLLWNWVVPIVFGLTKITFFQAFGILFIKGFIFTNINVKN